MARTIEIIARFSAQLKTLAALAFMGAFLFFLIACLSTPVIKSLYIMREFLRSLCLRNRVGNANCGLGHCRDDEYR